MRCEYYTDDDAEMSWCGKTKLCWSVSEARNVCNVHFYCTLSHRLCVSSFWEYGECEYECITTRNRDTTSTTVTGTDDALGSCNVL